MGFRDASLWENAKKKGDVTIKKLIREALKGTIVTVILIGTETARQEYIDYVIQKSIDERKGIFGIHIHNIKDPTGKVDEKGSVPQKLLDGGYKIYTWAFDERAFQKWVEAAHGTVRSK